MRSRRLVLGLVSWLVVVAVSSTIAWAVISRAGDNLVSTDDPLVVTQAGDGRPASVGTAGTAAPSATPTVAPTRLPPSQPSAPTEPSPSLTMSVAPVPSSSPARSTQSSLEPQRRTWQGTGGRLVVACDASRISLVAAQPDAGFKVGVGREGSVGLEVEFEGREDQDGRGSHVRATCVAGLPDFGVETHGGETDEHE